MRLKNGSRQPTQGCRPCFGLSAFRRRLRGKREAEHYAFVYLSERQKDSVARGAAAAVRSKDSVGELLTLRRRPPVVENHRLLQLETR